MLETEAKAGQKAAAREESAGYRSISTQRRINVIIKTTIAILAVIFALYPIVWIVSASINPANSLINLTLIPRNATLDNFQRLFNDPQYPFGLWIWNSIKVSGITAIVIVALTSIAAYSFSRFRYQGRRTGLLTILLIQLFPNSLAIVALFLLLQQIGKIPPKMSAL